MQKTTQRKDIEKNKQTDRPTSNSVKILLCCRISRCCTCISPFSHSQNLNRSKIYTCTSAKRMRQWERKRRNEGRCEWREIFSFLHICNAMHDAKVIKKQYSHSTRLQNYCILLHICTIFNSLSDSATKTCTHCTRYTNISQNVRDSVHLIRHMYKIISDWYLWIVWMLRQK